MTNSHFFSRLPHFAATYFTVAAIASTHSALAAETTATASKGKPVSVGLVFDIGGLGDKSFNDAAFAGLTRAKKELGASGEYREPVEGNQREAHLRNFARGETELIIGVGFLFTEEIARMANDFPKKKFACVDYTVSEEELPANLSALVFKEEEGSFLVGAIAALKSSTGKIGFVGGVESPLIKKFEAGYTQGARAVRPDVQVRSVYAGVTDKAFADPAKGRELAISLYDSGVDVIFHASGSTGLGVFRAAEEKKKFAIGVDADQAAEAAPGVILTSMLKNVSEAVFQTIQRVQNGTEKGGIHTFGLKENGVGYVYDDKNKALIGEDIRKKVEDLRAKIVAGEIVVKKTLE